MTRPNQCSRQVKHAAGVLIIDVLAKASDPETGYAYDCRDMTMGAIELGDWTIELTRKRKP